MDVDKTASSPDSLWRVIEYCGFHIASEGVLKHVRQKGTAGPSAKVPAGHDAMRQEMDHGGRMEMADMVRDMRNRFCEASVVTIPIFAYAPMGGMFTPPAPPFSLELWRFFLGNAAAIWQSWPLFVTAWLVLRNGTRNMAVLIVLVVLSVGKR